MPLRVSLACSLGQLQNAALFAQALLVELVLCKT
jgi:hypothetical protein